MSEQTQYTYDVFISYSHVQQEWVRGQLLPQLEKAGLKSSLIIETLKSVCPALSTWNEPWTTAGIHSWCSHQPGLRASGLNLRVCWLAPPTHPADDGR